MYRSIIFKEYFILTYHFGIRFNYWKKVTNSFKSFTNQDTTSIIKASTKVFTEELLKDKTIIVQKICINQVKKP